MVMTICLIIRTMDSSYMIMAFVLGVWSGTMMTLLTIEVIKKIKRRDDDKSIDDCRVCRTGS